MRQRAGIALAAALLIVGLGSASALIATLMLRAEQNRGWEDAALSGSVLPYRGSLAGVNAELSQYSAEELSIQLQTMADLGITWVRQEFPWAEIEPVQGQYDWATWDAIVDAVASKTELEIVAVLDTSPLWAADPDAPDSASAPPSDNADFARFAGVFAARYGDRIDYYQIWDEPNLRSGWGDLDPRVADYVQLLQGAYQAIHAADPVATVLMAGLAPTTEHGPANYSDVRFLSAIYENGGRDYFDAVAAKPYGFDTGPEDRRVDESILNFSRIILLREEMVRRGDGNKAIWGTQFGWNALPAGWTGQPSIWGNHSREEQSDYIRSAYSRAAVEWPWLGGLILYHWQPDAPANDPIWGFSLIPPGGSSIDIPANLFSGGRNMEAAQSGRYHPLSSYASYSGDWEFSELGTDPGQRENSRARFIFEGSSVAFELRRDDYRAYLFVTVDGQPANALPRDSQGRGYIILTSSDLLTHMDIIPAARDLSPGTHTLEMIADRGWDQWPLAAYRVSTPLDNRGPMAQMLLWAGLFLLSAIGLVSLIRRIEQPLIPVTFFRQQWERLGQVIQVIVAGAASLLLMLGLLLTWNDSLPTLIRRDPPGLLLGLFTAGILYFSPSLVLTLLSLAILWLVIFQRLEIGLLLTLFWAPFFLFPVELSRYAFTMSEVCILLTASAWVLQKLISLARIYRNPGPKPLSMTAALASWNGLDICLALLFLLAALSITWTDYQHVALREFRTMILEPALFYLIARTTLRQSEEIVRLANTLILAAVVATSISIAMYFSGQGVVVAEEGTLRMAGIYGSPNNIGLLVARTIPFALASLLLSAERRKRILMLIALLVMLVAAALSQSAGALLLGIPAGFFVVLLLWKPRTAAIVVAIMAAAGVIVSIPLSQHPRFTRLFDFSSGSSFFRLRLWQSTLQMIEDRPITGLGLDQFLYNYRGRYILPEAWQEPNLSHPHNILLDFWIRLGLGGVLLLVAIQFIFWRMCWRLYRRFRENPSLSAVLVGAMGSMAALVLHGMVDNSVFVLDLSYIFALLLVIPGLIQAKTALADSG